MRFGEMKVETNGEQHVFEVQIYLNDLDPNAARVELMPTASTATVPCGRRWSAFANCQARPAATSIAHGCPRPVRPPTIQRE